jgi:hypothetical protein
MPPTQILFAQAPRCCPIDSFVPTLASRFSIIVRDVRRAVEIRLGREPAFATLWPPLCVRLTWVARRFAALAEQFRAGTLKPRRSPSRPISRQPPARRANALPRRHGWLVAMGPSWEVAPFGGQLHHLLTADPEAIALLEAAPQLKRYLRPIARMLAVPPIPALAPPPRPQRHAAARQGPRAPRERRAAIPKPQAAGWPSPPAQPGDTLARMRLGQPPVRPKLRI